MQFFDFHFGKVNFKLDEEEKKNNKGESTDILKIIESLTKIFTFLGMIIYFVTKYFNYYYAMESSRYYGIPISYFIENPLTDSIVLKILIFIIPFFIFLMPTILITVFKMSAYDKFEVGMLSFANSILLLVFFIDIIVNIVFMITPNSSDDFKIGLSVIVFLIIASLLTFMYYKFYESVLTITNNNILDSLLHKNKKDNVDVKEDKDNYNDLNSKDSKDNSSKIKDINGDINFEDGSSNENSETEEDDGEIHNKEREDEDVLAKNKEDNKNNKNYKYIIIKSLIIVLVIVITVALFRRSSSISKQVKVEKNFNSGVDHNFEIIVRNKYTDVVDSHTLYKSNENNSADDSDNGAYKTYYDELVKCEKNRGSDNENTEENQTSDFSSLNDYFITDKDKLILDIIVIRKKREAITIKGYIEDNVLYILKGQYRMQNIDNEDIININIPTVQMMCFDDKNQIKNNQK